MSADSAWRDNCQDELAAKDRVRSNTKNIKTNSSFDQVHSEDIPNDGSVPK